MKKIALILFLALFTCGYAQNIQVDAFTYSPQELIEDILINSDCISNVTVTNVVGGNFNSTDESYGYFNGAGTSFPFIEGLVLSTGRLQNVPGPNNNLSDDDAPNWQGDNDLETILNESNTFNATIIEFEFTTIADQINFNYLFASEEYQEGNANTCQFSDLFGFLIRPASSNQYENIALVPNTQTPVKVTTVHSGIPGACDPINEAYFGSWNGVNVPINFNGQTTVLTATANVLPNEVYHVKLVIADEQNYRYDSAVFLEAGSLLAGKNLGPNRLFTTNNPLCENETLWLDATMPGNNSYAWFKDGMLLPTETNELYQVTEAGTYQVEITFANNCKAFGTITIEYDQNPALTNTSLTECDLDNDGFTFFNLFDAEQTILNGDSSLILIDFFESLIDAENNQNPISNPEAYQNTTTNQIVYTRVETTYGCYAVAEIQLSTVNNPITIPIYYACYISPNDISIEINLAEVTATFENQIPNNSQVSYYLNENDAFTENNPLPLSYSINTQSSQLIYVKVISATGDCYAITTVTLSPDLAPQLIPDESVIYCLNTFPETILLEAGVADGNNTNYSYEWFLDGNTLSLYTETIAINQTGTFSVVVENNQGCSNTRSITVNPSEIGFDGSVNTSGNTATIGISGTGNYEYNIDHGPYQGSSSFNNIPIGEHVAYVRDINGCGVVEIPFKIFGFPKFFTPNGDGYHDTWKPLGLANSEILTITVFDRYGKLLKQFNSLTNGWNGTFNGNELPTGNYWYQATDQDGKTYQGYFALKR